jgi:hypothetical protein
MAEESTTKLNCAQLQSHGGEGNLTFKIEVVLTVFLHFSQQGLDFLELVTIAGPVSLAQ